MFEYKITTLNEAAFNLEDHLNRLGSQGWEIVRIDQNDPQMRCKWHIVWKRAK